MVLLEITLIDSPQSCLPPIDRPHNTAHPANLPHTIDCPPDNHNFPLNANLPLPPLWAYRPTMAPPKLTPTTASYHATPHPLTILTLIPTADKIYHKISLRTPPMAQHTPQKFESTKTRLDYSCNTHTNSSQSSHNSRIISTPNLAKANQLCTICTPIHPMTQQLQQQLAITKTLIDHLAMILKEHNLSPQTMINIVHNLYQYYNLRRYCKYTYNKFIWLNHQPTTWNLCSSATLTANPPQLLLLPAATCYNHPGQPTHSMYWYWTPPWLPCYNIASTRTHYASTEILQSHIQHTVLHSKDLLNEP